MRVRKYTIKKIYFLNAQSSPTQVCYFFSTQPFTNYFTLQRYIALIITIQTYCIETKLTGDRTSEHMSKNVSLISKLLHLLVVFDRRKLPS